MFVFQNEEPLLTVTILHENSDYVTKCLMDSGATVSFINTNLVNHLHLPVYESPGYFRSLTDSFKTEYKCKLSFQLKGKLYTHDFFVYNIPYDVLIGRDILVFQPDQFVNFVKNDNREYGDIDIINDSELQFLPVFNITDSNSKISHPNPLIHNLLQKHASCFSQHCGELPKKFEFTVELIDSNVKYKYIPPRRVPLHFQEEVRRQINDLLDRGIIERSESMWSFPIRCTTKANGQVRMCFDARELNKLTVKHKTVLPHFEEVLSRVSGAKCLSAIDITSGYLHVPVDTKSQEYLSFCPGPGFGNFKFKRMPFGVANGPSHFQFVMRNILGDCPFVFIFVDDILVFSKTLEEHVQHLETVFQRLSSYNIKSSLSKCQFLKDEIKYLGHTIKSNGTYSIPDQKKHILASISLPQTYGDLEHFLGLINYYSKFVSNFSTVISPLLKFKKEMEHPKKSSILQWSPSLIQTFEEIKSVVINSTPLAVPDISKKFEVETDASNDAVGATLLQNGVPVTYASRVFTSTERKYSTYEKELLAIIFALKRFRDCLIGSKFVLRTDHKPLKWLQDQQLDGASRVSRWSMYLMTYDFEIEHIPGKLNNIADYLSRNTVNAVYVPSVFNPNFKMEQQYDQDLLNFNTSSKYCKYKVHMHTDLGVIKFKSRIVVPDHLQKDLLTNLHASLGHCGIKRMSSVVATNYFWPNMYKDISEHILHCSSCQMSKSYRLQNTKMMYSGDNSKPFDSISLDLKAVKNTFLVVIMCLSTRYVKFYFIKSKSSDNVRDCFLRFIYQFGKPSQVLTDNGLEFGGGFASTLHNLGISHVFCAPYHHEGNGQVERMNRWIEERLVMDSNFVNKLEYYECLHNNFVNSTTGLRPNDLIFKFMYCSPLYFSHVSDKNNVRVHPKFRVGDTVLIKNINRRKGTPYFHGDRFRIIDICRESFLLENDQGVRFWRHSSHVKLI